MKSSILSLALPNVPAATPLHGAGAPLQANREPQSASDAIPDDFLAALGKAGAPNSLKINVSAVSPSKMIQSASGLATTIPGMKHPAAGVVAIGTAEKGTMLQKEETSGKAEPVAEASVQPSRVPTATLLAPDPVEPCMPKPDIAPEPAPAAAPPALSSEVRSPVTHAVHAKA